jgi:hypothetical protein
LPIVAAGSKKPRAKKRKKRASHAQLLRKAEDDVRQLYADYRAASPDRRKRLRRRVDLAIERYRVLKKGTVTGPSGVGIVRVGGPKTVGDSTAVHRTHARRFKTR